MNTPPLAETKSAARVGSRAASVVSLGNRRERHERDRSVTFKVKGRPTKAVIPKLPTAGEGYGPTGVIIDFALARERGHVAQAHKKPRREFDTNFTLTDCLMAAYVMASVAFYPSLVWFLLP